LDRYPHPMNIIQPWFVTLFGLAGVVNRQNQATIEYLVAENRILKEQLKKHGRIRFTDKQRFLLAVRAMELGRKALLKLETIVVCDTLLRWHRQLVANKYDSSASPRKQGRPRIKNELEALVVRMAKENLRWGYTRVRGAMHELGHALARSTISDILGRNGIVPAPERERTRKWADFLAAHWDVMAATDFFTVEVWSPLGLVRYQVLFVMELCTRKVHIAGIVHNPHGPWMKQVARNLTDEFDGFLTDKK
jgi:putative transposase